MAKILPLLLILLVLGFFLLWRSGQAPRPSSGEPLQALTPPVAPPPPAPAPPIAPVAAEPATAAAPAPALPPPAQSYQEHLEQLLGRLPTTERIQALPAADKHHTPALLAQAGAWIGEVYEEIERDPPKARDGMLFFTRCARREELDESVRAVCLSSLRDIARKVGIAVDEGGIPRSIVDRVNKMRAIPAAQ